MYENLDSLSKVLDVRSEGSIVLLDADSGWVLDVERQVG